MSPSCHKMRNYRKAQSGFALVITLLLVLMLMLLAAGIAYTSAAHMDLTSAVAYKPQSINAAETCFDDAAEWFSTPSGTDWLNSSGTAYDLAATTSSPLYGQNLLLDTLPTGLTETRNTFFQKIAGKAAYSSCVVTKVGMTSVRGVGSEVGTGGGSPGYTIKITANGNFNVVTNTDGTKKNWQSNSSQSVLEAVIDYVQ
jgi:Tfp pilus assembly protein PilX